MENFGEMERRNKKTARRGENGQRSERDFAAGGNEQYGTCGNDVGPDALIGPMGPPHEPGAAGRVGRGRAAKQTTPAAKRREERCGACEDELRWGDFLSAQKVTKDAVKGRVFRFPLPLTNPTRNDQHKGGCGPPYWMYPPGERERSVGRAACLSNYCARPGVWWGCAAPKHMGPPQKPNEVVFVGRGGARKRAQFSRQRKRSIADFATTRAAERIQRQRQFVLPHAGHRRTHQFCPPVKPGVLRGKIM